MNTTDSAINDQIDTAYRANNGPHSPPYVNPMLAEAVRATTMKLVPRGANA